MKPREKILLLGPEGITDKELLMLLIGSGVRGRSVDAVAEDLLDRFGNIYGVLFADIKSLMQAPGVGEATATRLVGVGSLIRRFVGFYLPEEEYLFVVCDENSSIHTLIIRGDRNKVEIPDINLLRICGGEVSLIHYHPEEKEPSLSDEEVLLLFRKIDVKVRSYTIADGRLNIFDVISKMDFIKGE